MGRCIYCGQSSGFLRKKDRECKEAHDYAVAKLLEFFSKLQDSNLPVEQFTKLAVNIAAKYHISQNEFRNIALRGLSTLIEEALEDHVLAHDEEDRISKLQKLLGLATNDLPSEIANKVVKSAILRDLSEGITPQRIHLDRNFPVNFQKDEAVVWVFQPVTYSKFSTQTRYVGGSHGVSIRLMKGLSYRVGSYRGQAVKSEHLVNEGSGNLILTDRNLYFVGPASVIRIPIHKIVGLQPYADGIAVTQSTANAKTQFFTLDDPMFAINAIAKLNQI